MKPYILASYGVPTSDSIVLDGIILEDGNNLVIDHDPASRGQNLLRVSRSDVLASEVVKSVKVHGTESRFYRVTLKREAPVETISLTTAGQLQLFRGSGPCGMGLKRDGVAGPLALPWHATLAPDPNHENNGWAFVGGNPYTRKMHLSIDANTIQGGQVYMVAMLSISPYNQLDGFFLDAAHLQGTMFFNDAPVNVSVKAVGPDTGTPVNIYYHVEWE